MKKGVKRPIVRTVYSYALCAVFSTVPIIFRYTTGEKLLRYVLILKFAKKNFTQV